MADIDFQQLSTVQNAQMPKPRTIASAATIAPDTCLSFISGTAAIVNIVPPVSGFHILFLWPLAAFTTTAAGNITTVLTAAIGAPVILFYNPVTMKYIAAEIPVAA
jgi:enamine deaminase RidA (YjgF/YER057c/UK114 family)